MKNDTKQKIVDMVLKKMEETKQTPWDSGFIACREEPVNLATGKAYRGVNSFTLKAFGRGANEYVTFKQAVKLGGKVRKGEHGLPVIWYTMWNKTQKRPANADDDETDEIIPYMRSATVFEVSQCDGLESKRLSEPRGNVRQNDRIDKWFDTFRTATKLTVEHTLQNASYSPTLHTISIRNIDEYNTDDTYYQTLMHEAVHSTGKHMGRSEFKKWGDHAYSEEEVVAEMGSLFLCDHFGIIKSQIDNSSVYINHWSQKLRENPNWLFKGVKDAEKAYDYMLKTGGEED